MSREALASRMLSGYLGSNRSGPPIVLCPIRTFAGLSERISLDRRPRKIRATASSRSDNLPAMRLLPFVIVAFLCSCSLQRPVQAQAPFPGVKSILTDAEWKRAGLDRMTPDEIGVIDAALIRHQRLTTPTLQIEVDQARGVAAATASATTGSQPLVDQKPTLLQRFGLPFSDVDWRTLPSMKAKVVSWEGGNRFKLDNGQVWEGSEAIPYELPGKEIEIQPRPNNRYGLAVEGQTTTIRVVRLK